MDNDLGHEGQEGKQNKPITCRVDKERNSGQEEMTELSFGPGPMLLYDLCNGRLLPLHLKVDMSCVTISLPTITAQGGVSP